MSRSPSPSTSSPASAVTSAAAASAAEARSATGKHPLEPTNTLSHSSSSATGGESTESGSPSAKKRARLTDAPPPPAAAAAELCTCCGEIAGWFAGSDVKLATECEKAGKNVVLLDCFDCGRKVCNQMILGDEASHEHTRFDRCFVRDPRAGRKGVVCGQVMCDDCGFICVDCARPICGTHFDKGADMCSQCKVKRGC